LFGGHQQTCYSLSGTWDTSSGPPYENAMSLFNAMFVQLQCFK
jgi:hypothetical protein